jgi:hypothetical protein
MDRGRLARRAVAVVASLVVTLAGALPATAATARTADAARVPLPVASVSGPASPRVDQDTTTTVVVRGASKAAAVTVRWGDAARSHARTTCSPATAAKRPARCTLTLQHRYDGAGTFAIAVLSGPRVVARSTIVVRSAPTPWSPPPGWVQPAGWQPYGGGATYVPCSTVLWFYDRSLEPAGAVGMHDEVVAGLAMLAAQTGLTFTETPDRSQAGLVYDWGDLESRYPGAAGIGGRVGDLGTVTFSVTHWWPTDQWPGFGVVTQPDGTYAVGRGWLVVHETMHALGFDHVNDVTSVMNPVGGATAFNAGDLDGLHTMYLNIPCPA